MLDPRIALPTVVVLAAPNYPNGFRVRTSDNLRAETELGTGGSHVLSLHAAPGAALGAAAHVTVTATESGGGAQGSATF